jgi:signal transduction histidine kinase
MTAGFALAMVLVLVAVGLFVYLRQRQDLNDTIDTGLRSRSDDVAALVRSGQPDLAGSARGRLEESEETFVQILTARGRWVDGTSRSRAPVLSSDELRRASRTPVMVERKVAGIEGTARVLARPVIAKRGARVVVTGASLQDRDETLSILLKSFLIGGPAVVLLASGIGYLLATAGLAPVEAMRRRADRISLSARGERLPLPKAQDEIRRLGETLNEMLARLEESFQRERRFVADASHELRTPLGVLKAELESALRRAGEEPELRESLLAALEETDHLAQLAEDLLLIARAAEGQLPLRRERVAVGELFERTRQRFADRARERGREIAIAAPADLHAQLDPLRGRQALANLVDNALRHGGGDVRLSGRRRDGTIEIDVSDEGPGFPDGFAARAFERFARNESPQNRGGAGLGLAIVRAIAEAHGGTAAIVESSERGATVRLRIPAAG